MLACNWNAVSSVQHAGVHVPVDLIYKKHLSIYISVFHEAMDFIVTRRSCHAGSELW